MVNMMLNGLAESLSTLDKFHGWDILTEEGMSLAKQLVIAADHVHIAFPCRSYTRARRQDEHGYVEVVRSDQSPMGWGHPVSEEGNAHLVAVVTLCLLALEHGTTFSLENPWDSFAWICPIMIKLLKKPGVRQILLDQCAYGGMSQKPTRIVTNTEWMTRVCRTCLDVTRHRHSKLEGKIWCYLEERLVWKTKKAAEYPLGLCIAWVNELKEYLTKGPGAQKMARDIMVRVGHHANVLVARDASTYKADEDTPGSTVQPESKGNTIPLVGKALRESENAKATGGLRDPRRCVATNADLRTVGQRIRTVLSEFVSPEVMQKFEKNPQSCPFDANHLSAVRNRLAEAFCTSVDGNGYEKNLIRAILHDAHDPDHEVLPCWLNEGFPLGINKPISNTGVFPATDDVAAAIKLSAAVGTLHEDWDGSARNYQSFYEAGEKAQNELDRLVQEGWAISHESWDSVVAAVGPNAVVTPIACIIKVKAGKEKVRLVVDMRRSGVNGQMKVLERVILPRISDVGKSLQELTKVNCDDQFLEFCIADFSDAFYTMKVHPDELCNIVVKDMFGKYLTITVCSFGLAAAPLLWGRLASMIMRVSQACLLGHEGRVQCFVDDPMIMVTGRTKSDRTWSILMYLLCWSALGFKVAWHKVNRGFTVDWIGVSLSLERFYHNDSDWGEVLHVALSEDKTSKLLEILSSLVEKPLIPIKQLQHAAGLLGWMSSIIPLARPWMSMVWAALQQAVRRDQQGSTRRRKGLAFRKQVDHAVRGLRALLQVRRRARQSTKENIRFERTVATHHLF